MCGDMHAHRRARASQAFVVRKCINIYFLKKMTYHFARLDPYSSAGTV